MIEHPACFLDIIEPVSERKEWKLLSAGGAAVRLSEEDLEALLLVEAASLVDKGDQFLLKIQAAPLGSRIRKAVDRVYAAIARVKAAPPPIIVRAASETTAAVAGCWPWKVCLPKAAVPLRVIDVPALSPRDPEEAGEEEVAFGSFLVDGEKGGPLCPPHLAPMELLPPSPLHASLPQQLVGPQALCKIRLIRALEDGIAVSPPSPPYGRVFEASELFPPRAALADDDSKGAKGEKAGRLELAVEVASVLTDYGFLYVDVPLCAPPCGEEEFGVVQRAFDAAEQFFRREVDFKVAATWRCGALGKHCGFRSEGPREFFAVREEEGETNTRDFLTPPPWRELYALQRDLARNVFSLLGEAFGMSRSTLQDMGVLPRIKNGGRDEQSTSLESSNTDKTFASVMRVYRYLRPEGSPAPGLRGAATGAHADAGLLTVAPISTVPGLVLLSPCGRYWLDVEGGGAGVKSQRFICFLGEAGARLFTGLQTPRHLHPHSVLRAPVHFVQEREGVARFSSPFFLRAPGEALLSSDPPLSYEKFMEYLVQRPWARFRGQDVKPEEWAAEF